MNTTSDKLKGSVKETVGKAKETVGNIVDDHKLSNSGTAQKIEGKLDKKEAEAKDLIKKGLSNAGDLIETLGDKIESAGFKKIGDAVEKLGNKIEHLAD